MNGIFGEEFKLAYKYKVVSHCISTIFTTLLLSIPFLANTSRDLFRSTGLIPGYLLDYLLYRQASLLDSQCARKSSSPVVEQTGQTCIYLQLMSEK